jgi:hypothetical protein
LASGLSIISRVASALLRALTSANEVETMESISKNAKLNVSRREIRKLLREFMARLQKWLNLDCLIASSERICNRTPSERIYLQFDAHCLRSGYKIFVFVVLMRGLLKRIAKNRSGRPVWVAQSILGVVLERIMEQIPHPACAAYTRGHMQT